MGAQDTGLTLPVFSHAVYISLTRPARDRDSLVLGLTMSGEVDLFVRSGRHRID